MKVKSRAALSGLAALLPLTLSGQVSWTGGSTPDTDWATPGNWSSAPAAPTAGDTVTIDAGHAFVTTTDAAAADLTVGDTGAGELTVSAGGVLTVSAGSILGADMGSSGSATVSGAGAIWNTGVGDLVVGSFGQGSLTVSDGGVVNSVGVDLASGSAGDEGATQGTVRITGASSAWNVTGAFKMGAYVDEETYTHASLTLADGGSLTLTATEGVEESGTLKLYNNGIIQIGEGGAGGTLAAVEIAFEDTGPLDPDLSPSGALATLAFNHSDDIALNALLSGGGLLTKTGAGTLTLTGNSAPDIDAAVTFSGHTTVSGGALVLDVGGYWDGDGKFAVTGSSSVLKIAGGTTLANDLFVTDGGAVLVEGALEGGSIGNTFVDGVLQASDGGEIIDGDFSFLGDSRLDLQSAATLSGGEFDFGGTSLLHVNGGEITDGEFNFDESAGLTLDTAASVSGGYFAFLGNSGLTLNATGAMSDATVVLYGGVTVTLGADETLDNTNVTMVAFPILDEESGEVIGTANPVINLDGHDVTFSGIDAQGGEIINNSAGDSTVTFAVGCGCGGPYSTFFSAFTEQSTGKIHVRVVGGAELVMGGTQTYTGTTVVDASSFYFVNTTDEDFNPVPSVLVSSPITLRNGGVLGGDGTVNAVTIENGGGLAPGDFGSDYAFAGPLTADSLTITSDLDHLVPEQSFLLIDIYDADSNLAPGVGVDFLNILGDLTFSADLNDTFTVHVRSLGDDVNNLALNFDPGLSRSWQIASIGGGIVNFDPSRIFVDASLFNNAIGLWTLTRGVLNDKELYLNYSPIPEPAAYTLLGSLAVLPALLRRRRRTRA